MTSSPTDVLARQRSRRLLSGIATSAMVRAVAVLVPLILIPLTLSYLGADLYGLWMAVAALTAMAAFADLGLGYGLMTKLAPCYSSGDSDTARRYISSAYVLLTAIAVGACALLWLFAGTIPWSSLLNVKDPALASQAQAMAITCLTIFLLNVPLSLVTSVQYAYQQVAQSNVWQAAGSLSSLCMVVTAVHARLPPAMVLAAALAGAPLANAVNSIWLYGLRQPDLGPRLRYAGRRVTRTLSGLGAQFFLLTIVMALAVNVDLLLIAHVLGLATVTSYAVPARLFAQLGLLVALINLPLWPANGEALARGNLAWVRRITRRMTVASALTVLLPALVLILTADALLAAWIGSSLDAPRSLLTGLAVWWVVQAAISPRFMVQNSAGIIGPQLLGWSAYLVLSIPVKWLGLHALGVVAVPVASAAIYVFTVVPSAVWGYRLALSRATAETALVPARADPVS